ncbi:MAG: tRNA pseudouridine(38-40) synthase TruA [Prochlorotrichaceae cyanobacterium]
MELQRIALVLQYLGQGFHGWQRQPNHRSVQATLEDTIATIVNHPVRLYGAGRTDAGVHAAAQVAHFEVCSQIPAHRWASVLNAHLPPDVLIRGSAAVSPQWHAQYSASWRRYRYTLYTNKLPNLFLKPYVWHYYRSPLAVDAMRAALEPLKGFHNLEAFQRAGSSRPHAWLEVQEVVCQQRSSHFIEIEVQASGFLYGMMRFLVGLLVQVGEGSRSLDSFTDIWQNRRRAEVKHSAPAAGLCLLRVGYPEFPFSPEVWLDAHPLFSFEPL